MNGRHFDVITESLSSEMSRRTAIRALGGGLAATAVLGGLGLARPERALAARQRPISDFVEAQGTYCVDDGAGGCFLFVPPVANFIGWVAPKQNRAASLDYAGLADKYLGGALGTKTAGTVTEQKLDDGRAKVTVELRTTNALAWAIPWDPADPNPFGDNELLFGYRVDDPHFQPALGESEFQVVFKNTELGAPLPDLLDLLINRFADLISLSFWGRAHGALRRSSGDTPGRLTVVQTGLLFRTKFKGATADGFPAEYVNLREVGS